MHHYLLQKRHNSISRNLIVPSCGGSCALPGNVMGLFLPLTCSSALKYHARYIYTHTHIQIHAYICIPLISSHSKGTWEGEESSSVQVPFFGTKKKSCTVPETHELFNYSQVHYLSYCTNVHILTYTKKQDEGCTQIRLPGQLWIPTVGTPGEARLFHLPGQQELFTAAPQRLE